MTSCPQIVNLNHFVMIWVTQLSQFLKLGVSDAPIEKWEKDISRPSEPCRTRIVEFLGFNPDPENSTGESPVEHLLQERRNPAASNWNLPAFAS
jgi:hypothetical protein